jgi:hypothetical protein
VQESSDDEVGDDESESRPGGKSVKAKPPEPYKKFKDKEEMMQFANEMQHPGVTKATEPVHRYCTT